MGIVLKILEQPGTQFQVERIEHNMRPFSWLLKKSFTLLNVELNDKQPIKK
jgi:hypothetical protein